MYIYLYTRAQVAEEQIAAIMSAFTQYVITWLGTFVQPNYQIALALKTQLRTRVERIAAEDVEMVLALPNIPGLQNGVQAALRSGLEELKVCVCCKLI
jgi:hypothetical protein